MMLRQLYWGAYKFYESQQTETVWRGYDGNTLLLHWLGFFD